MLVFIMQIDAIQFNTNSIQQFNSMNSMCTPSLQQLYRRDRCSSWQRLVAHPFGLIYPKIVIWVRMIQDDHRWSMRFWDPVLDKAMKAMKAMKTMFYFERFWNILKRCCRCSPKRQRQTQPLSFETGREIWDDATGLCRTLQDTAGC